MTQVKRIGLVAGLALGLAGAALLIAGARAELPFGSVAQIQILSAAQDGAAWALTTDGRLLHCRFDPTAKKVACYGREGEAQSDY